MNLFINPKMITTSENTWSEQHLKAAKHAQWAAAHYRKAADYYKAGKTEKAIHHALLAITQIDYSSQRAQQAKEYCFKAMLDDSPET